MSLFQELQKRRARVLFVCLANSSCSQIAEALAQPLPPMFWKPIAPDSNLLFRCPEWPLPLWPRKESHCDPIGRPGAFPR